MSRKPNIAVKTLVVASALTACLSGVARADDSSMGRFGGDSYAYFNRVSVSSAPSDWRTSRPQGMSENALEAESSEQLGWDLQPNPFAATPSSDPSFRQTHPDGLTERELQALSSETSPWQLRRGGASGAVEGADQTSRAENAPHSALGARLAAIFHRGADADASVTR